MRILILHPFGIGDVLFSFPLLEALRRRFPEGYIGYLCNRRTEELVAACPQVNRRFVFEKDVFRALWARSTFQAVRLLFGLIRQVRLERFDIALDLSLGSQIGLACWLAGIPQRIGFDFRGRGRFLTDKIPIHGFHNYPVADYYLQLLEPLGIPASLETRLNLSISSAEAAKAADCLRSKGIGPGERLIGLVPGGGISWGPSAVFKQWPPSRFSELADQVAARKGARILLIGDASETALCRTVAARMKFQPVLATDISSLMVLAGLLQRCDLVIGNDSGPIHLAEAVGVKTVSIFGPVDGAVYGPIQRDMRHHRIVSLGLPCRPCYQGFRFPPCPWGNACLTQLPVSDVAEAAEALLS